MQKAIAMTLATVVAFAGVGVPADAVERDTLVCGTLTAHEPSSSTESGSVTVGGSTIVLAAEPLYSSHPGTQAQLKKIGSAMCFSATFNAQGEAAQYLVNPMPAQLCGKVITVERPTVTAAGAVRLEWLGIGTFAIRAGTDLGPETYPGQPCFRLALDPAGRAEVVGRVLTIADRTVVHLHVCGRVTQWTTPTVTSRAVLLHESAGTITIGSRRYDIVAGTEYSLVNSPPIVGQPTCMSAALDAQGRIIQYAAQPGLARCFTSSPPDEYVAPTPTADGSVHFRVGVFSHTPDSYRYRIPAGTLLPRDVSNGEYCWILSLDDRGDAVVSGAERPRDPGGVAGPMPGIGSLPNTSTR